MSPIGRAATAQQDSVRTPVLIVGAGPVGLGMAIDLAWRGIDTLVVEQGDGRIEHPRTGLIAIRTMELCRRWGLAQAIRDSGFPPDYELSMVFCTALEGLLLGKEFYPGMAATPTPPETPEKKQRCPQMWMQPVLADAAAALPQADMRYHHRFLGFTQDETGVTSRVEDIHGGRTFEVRSDYLLACDGATSPIRESLGIAMPGRLLSYSVNILIRAPGLTRKHRMGQAERYLFVGPEGTWGNLTVIDGADLWRLTILGSAEKFDLDNFDAAYWVRRAFGTDAIDFEVTSVIPWRRSETLAERYSDRRVFLAGDSAHTMSPTGGMVMNTGMQEVMDLGWKLEGALRGWGGPGLLASYDIERRPVAARNIGFSTQNFRAWQDVPDTRAIGDNTAEGERLRAAVGQRRRDSTRVEWESTSLQIGHRYEGSPICVPDGSPPTPDDYSHYVPSARPGCRAPHAWLADGRSTLDLFGRGFVLLAFDPAAATAPLEAACAARGVPLGGRAHRRPGHRGLVRTPAGAGAALGSCGRLTATQVCGHSNMHKTKVSRAVRALEARRWLKRSVDERDRRTEHLELTTLGRRSYEELARLAQDYAAELQRLLGDPALAQLDSGLSAIERSMRADASAPGAADGSP